MQIQIFWLNGLFSKVCNNIIIFFKFQVPFKKKPVGTNVSICVYLIITSPPEKLMMEEVWFQPFKVL